MRLHWRASFGALLVVLPAAATVATVALFLVDWPDEGNRGFQLAVALGVGVLAWVLAAVIAGPSLTRVETASSETYDELYGRVTALSARLGDLEGVEKARRNPGQEAVDQAKALVQALRRDLRVDDDSRDKGAPNRWLLGHGYVNAWRELHQAEDVLLAVEPAEVVYATALTNLDRIDGSEQSTTTKLLTEELEALVKTNGARTNGGKEASAPASRKILELALVGFGEEESGDGHEAMVARFDADWARGLVREGAYRIHKTANEAWDQIVNLRNQLRATLALAIWLTYGILALAVLQPVGERQLTATQLTAAVSFFLVGAVVGVFRELSSTSERDKGDVFDYGLARARLLATPVLSGVAALGGVLITNLAGSFLIEGGGGTEVPALSQIFDLTEYPMGLVVAAVFGLTPSLFLSKMKTESERYTEQISQLSPTSTGSDTSAGVSATATPAGV